MDAKSQQCVSRSTQNSTGRAFIYTYHQLDVFALAVKVQARVAWLWDLLGSLDLAAYERLSGLHIFQMVYVPYVEVPSYTVEPSEERLSAGAEWDPQAPEAQQTCPATFSASLL